MCCNLPFIQISLLCHGMRSVMSQINEYDDDDDDDALARAKSATLNDLERRNGRYVALFH